MQKKRLLWQVYNSYLLIIIISLLTVTWYASRSLRQFYLSLTVDGLKSMALLVSRQIPEYPGNAERIDFLCKWLAEKASTRITIILPSGDVIGDSLRANPAKITNQSLMYEFEEAMTGKTVTVTRYSKMEAENLIYVATPLMEGKDIIGVVRVSLSESYIDNGLSKIYYQIVLGGGVIAVFAAVIGLVFSRRISQPLEEMRAGAEQFARGELNCRLPVSDSEEIGGLAEAMNIMAAQLDDRILTIMEQRNLQDAILFSMVEGVVAVDTSFKIITLNQAASELLNVPMFGAINKEMDNVIGNSELKQFTERALSSEEPVEGDIIIEDAGARFLQVHGTALKDSEGESIGALIVLNDVTRLRLLEDLQRGFVGNVSHELKTPVTSIQGFAETLLDGAINNPDDARRFIEIIAKHSMRLNAIIEDLLSLSRIGQEYERNKIVLRTENLKSVLNSAMQLCEVRAHKKSISFDLKCDDSLEMNISSTLVEQAIANFISNAIKYSSPGDTVRISGYKVNSEVTVEVRDKGCGIGDKHLPHIFERFYRVDKARSRKLGGTGLGLAITKSIAQVHKGRVSVDSILGKGSVFFIHFPYAETLKNSDEPKSMILK